MDMYIKKARSGPSSLLNRLFGWRHLMLMGVVFLLAITLLRYRYAAVVRILLFYVLSPISLMLLGRMLWQEKLLRYLDMKLLLASLVWLIAVYVLNASRTDIYDSALSLITFFTVALLVFPLAYCVGGERRMKTFDLLALLWIIPVFCAAVFGIALAIDGGTYYTQPDNVAFGIVGGRLTLFHNPIIFGMLCCLALGLVMYLLLGKRKAVVRVLLIIVAIVLFIGLSLTDCRSAKIALLPAAFFLAAIGAHRLVQRRRMWLRLLVSALAGVALCAVTFFGYRAVSTGVNTLQAMRAAASAAVEEAPAVEESPAVEEAPAIEAAPAPASVPAPVTVRQMNELTTVNQRLAIWTHALGRLTEEKDTLLRGATPALAHSTLFINPLTPYAHLHNAYLGVLISYGVPGFLLMVAFLVYLAVCAVRLLFSGRRDLPDAIRFLPVLLLPILTINLVEEMLFTQAFPSAPSFWLAAVSGYTIVLSREWRAKKPPAGSL